MSIDRYFQIVAVILAGIAVFFLWQGNTDGLFVSAVLGAVAFFLSIRFQTKERNRVRQEQADEAEEAEDEAEEPEEITPAKSEGEIEGSSAESDPTGSA